MSEQIAANLGFTHLNVGAFVKDHQCYESLDETYDSYILDEDKLLDLLEPILESESGGYIIDFHTCDIFPERWIDLVLVLTSSTGWRTSNNTYSN